LIALSCPVFGQTPAQIEKELVGHIKNIRKWSSYTNSYDEKMGADLYKENETFKTKLLKHSKKLSTLKYKFAELNKYISISTSDDNKFRIYSWDTETGGTMHNFENVYQFQGKNGKAHSSTSSDDDETGAGAFVSDIYTLDTKAGKVYLARFSAILSTSLSYQSIDLFKIENNSLNDKIKLFRTTSGLQNSIGFQYDFFSVVDRKERPIKLILYDKQAKVIKIPVVIEDKKNPNGRVTNKFIVYRFNGTYFVKAS
jgi:hypothetical protein